MSELSQLPQAPLDGLLEIPTRAILASELTRLAGHPSLDQPLSVLLIDLDKFKQVNDLHSHEANRLQSGIPLGRNVGRERAQS